MASEEKYKFHMGVLQTCKREYYAFFADSEEKYKFHMGVLQTCKKEYYAFFC